MQDFRINWEAVSVRDPYLTRKTEKKLQRMAYNVQYKESYSLWKSIFPLFLEKPDIN